MAPQEYLKLTHYQILAGQCARELDFLVEMVKTLNRQPFNECQIEGVQIGRQQRV